MIFYFERNIIYIFFQLVLDSSFLPCFFYFIIFKENNSTVEELLALGKPPQMSVGSCSRSILLDEGYSRSSLPKVACYLKFEWLRHCFIRKKEKYKYRFEFIYIFLLYIFFLPAFIKQVSPMFIKPTAPYASS